MLSAQINHISLVAHVICHVVDMKDVVVVNTIPFEDHWGNWCWSVWFQLIAFQVAQVNFVYLQQQMSFEFWHKILSGPIDKNYEVLMSLCWQTHFNSWVIQVLLHKNTDIFRNVF